MIDLHNKTILVSGASRGIGAAMNKVFSESGANVIPHASRASDHTDDSFLYQDLSKPKAGEKLFAAALEKFGRIDAVVNNAGVYLPSSLSGDDWQAGWETTIAVNVQAPADICRAAIAHFKENGGGHIVNIASRAGHRGDGGAWRPKILKTVKRPSPTYRLAASPSPMKSQIWLLFYYRVPAPLLWAQPLTSTAQAMCVKLRKRKEN